MMQVKVLSYVRNSIPYVKELRPIFGSPVGCILGQQLDYWFERYPNGFYKFMQPAPDRSDYREGDSWEEELGFSAKEFRTAFDFFGIRYKSASAFRAVENPFIREDGTVASYCSVFNRRTGQTKYFRNHEHLDRQLQKVLFTVNAHREVTETPNGNLQNCPSGTSRTAHRADVYTEPTPEPTSEPTPDSGSSRKRKLTPPAIPFEDFYSLYPKKRKRQDAEIAWAKLTEAQMNLAIADMRKNRAHRDSEWLDKGGKFIPLPATYLNGKRWEDEWESPSDFQQATVGQTINVAAQAVDSGDNLPANTAQGSIGFQVDVQPGGVVDRYMNEMGMQR